ncbi:diaminopropionate ammonia-lyase [Selenomonas sputigena]|uniref:Diaminopropionate ammonia-lyase n=1 Tax=Selenomonas sputigena TaxID=69823 RepID=A0ABV3X7R8_9FIRM
MNETIKAVRRRHGKALSDVSAFGVEEAKKARAFHRSFPTYKETPLESLKNLAQALGISDVFVKDESKRFGLNAFKGLGASYCLGNLAAEQLALPVEELSYARLTDSAARKTLAKLTVVTATDGNHGRGIAWTAKELGIHAVVYMPKGSAPERLENIQKLGAKAAITDFNYDDTVRFANEQAQKNGWTLTQDTAWEGYQKIPRWIMQGYTTMAAEAAEQLPEKPTHIFLQAGVGAMAGAVAGFFASLYGKERPTVVIVEPNKADCIYRTAAADDGQLHFVTGDMASIMAGLCCGEPCSIGWDILKDHADVFASVPDWVAAKGMRILSSPLGEDPRIISGESGAATLGFLAESLQNEALAEMRQMLALDAKSRVLCFSTEGDTDRENYQRIVWDGLCPSF